MEHIINHAQSSILLINLAILLCILQYRNIFVIVILRRASKLCLKTSLKYINDIPKQLNNEDFNIALEKSDRFRERLDKLPNQLLMIFMFHAWTYKQLVGTYEEDLQKIYEENLNNVSL